MIFTKINNVYWHCDNCNKKTKPNHYYLYKFICDECLRKENKYKMSNYLDKYLPKYNQYKYKTKYKIDYKKLGSCDICYKKSSIGNRLCNKCFYKIIGKNNEM